MHQQNGAGGTGVTAIANKLGRIGQTGRARSGGNRQRTTFNRVTGCVCMRARRQSCGRIEHITRIRNDLCTTGRIVTRAELGAAIFGNDIRAIKRVVQAAPAGIGRVQRVTGIGDRHHQLGAGDGRDFRVHIGGFDAECLAFSHQIADLGQEGLVGRRVEFTVTVRLVPGIELGLKVVALCQQFRVARAQLVDQ